MTWSKVGPVVQLQIHVDRMVNNGVYEHELIRSADALWLGPDGVLGMVDGHAAVHAHHRLHPNKTRADNRREFRPKRLVSIGFTGHYAAMAEQFGAAEVGCAAEDIIVDYDGVMTVDDLAGGVQLRRGEHVVDLVGIAVAKPCVPFTKWLLNDQDAADDLVGPNRAFLDAGMRGFVMGLDNQEQAVEVLVGDELWRRG